MSAAQSFAGLVKSNNGEFKSKKQAAFLLSQCKNGEYVSSGSFYGHSFDIHYACDERGVKSVTKYAKNTGFVVQWQRRESGTVAIQDRAELKRITREMNALKKRMSDREKAFEAGEYASCEELYNSASLLFVRDMTEWQERFDQFAKFA